MNIIIDVQGFKIENNKFVPKELVAYNGVNICHYIFRPPFPMDYLFPDLLKQTIWLMKNHHCIDWKEGFTPLHKCGDIIKRLCEKADYLYVKGAEEADFLRKYSTKPVIEMDEQPALQ